MVNETRQYPPKKNALPCYFSPLGITKMLFHRRDVDAVQRGSAFKIADSLSRVLQSHISWKRPGTLIYYSYMKNATMDFVIPPGKVD
jgi:hypothetical protein